jgi:predicted dehydrogenase
MRLVTIAVVGCGRIAHLAHLRVLSALPGVKVAAIADPDPARLAEAARLVPGAARFADYYELFTHVPVDASVLTLPPALHAEAAVAAFEHGHHVYLEKPLATNIPDADRVTAAWKRSGRIGMLGFNYRFHPLYRTARRHLRDAALGNLAGARTVFSSASRTLPEWKRRRQTGGGALPDLASHHIDLAWFLFREPVVEVSSFVRSGDIEADSATLQLVLANGLPMQTFCSIDSVTQDRFDIYGRHGCLHIDRYAQTLSLGAAAHHDGRLARLQREVLNGAGALRRVLRASGEPSYPAALEAFVSAVRRGTAGDDDPSIADGHRSLLVVDAAERSAESGGVVKLAPQTPAPVPQA